jgi:hypothetical protein
MMNDRLYHVLKVRFGEVHVSNEGERLVEHKHYDPVTRTYGYATTSPGEYYRVCCPYCKDRRFRLYVSYRWNTLEDGKPYGRRLIVCHNERCSMRHFEDELHLYIGNRPNLGKHDESVREEFSYAPTTLPGRCLLLSELPPNHAARAYVEKRKFDPNELAAVWDVRYCAEVPEDAEGFVPGTRAIARMVRGRLIVPVYRSGDLVGWQARALGSQEPKYYTAPGFKKSQLLFNGDRARRSRFGVVVEGVFDAFRVGERAVALMGKAMSLHQRQLALSYWGAGALCIMLDADAIEDMERIANMIGKDSFRWGSFCVTLPPDMDPADMDRDSLWGLIVNYARTRGIQLTPT